MAKAASRPAPTLVALVFTLFGAAAGCGTDAKGVDACREIEQERCRQAPACPDNFRVQSEEDVEACVRFYRDQCLHGTATVEPGKPTLDACLQTIRRAGTCARSGAATLADCDAQVSTETTLQTACEVLVHPERTAECSFLVPVDDTPQTPQADAGSDGGDEKDEDEKETESGEDESDAG